MTKTKVRRLLALASGLKKLAKTLPEADRMAAELETLAHGAENTPHKSKKIEMGRFSKAIQKVAQRLGKNPFALIGGLAVQHWINVRATDDLDFILLTKDLSLVKKLFPKGSETHLVYTVKIEGIDVDFMDSHRFAWTKNAIDKAVKKTESGIAVPITTPEYLILYKLYAARPRDQEDIKALLRLEGVYSKSRKLVQEYFSSEDVEDLDQLAHEAQYDL